MKLTAFIFVAFLAGAIASSCSCSCNCTSETDSCEAQTCNATPLAQLQSDDAQAKATHPYTAIGKEVKWTSWFSEEQDYSEALSYPITGVGCKGDYCDDKRLVYVKGSSATVGGNEKWTDWFSEEDKKYFGCNEARVVSQFRCRGRYCDDLRLRCSDLKGGLQSTRQFVYVRQHSDEEGERVCPEGSYLNGIHCYGRFCDDISMRCVKVVYETSNPPKMDFLATAEKFKPSLYYDSEYAKNCMIDWPSSANNNKCQDKWLDEPPVFWERRECKSSDDLHYYIFSYWHWYGRQKDCTPGIGGHDNDWEHVNVHVIGDSAVSKVVYYQHDGWYTRRRDEFKTYSGRPILWVGKVAHGSYHCRCSWTGSITNPEHCAGGCGYWEDFRNPSGDDCYLRNAKLHDLKPGSTIDGIQRPNRYSEVCQWNTCHGESGRLPTTSGCWQNRP